MYTVTTCTVSPTTLQALNTLARYNRSIDVGSHDVPRATYHALRALYEEMYDSCADQYYSGMENDPEFIAEEREMNRVQAVISVYADELLGFVQ